MPISAKIVKDSISELGHRITTFELEFPRFILAEMNTHRVFSRNTQSSRAVPVTKVLEAIEADPVFPIEYGRNQSGMTSSEVMDEPELSKCQNTWEDAMTDALLHSNRLTSIGLHKQWSNRLVEPFQHIKVVLTSTEFNNFFWLRIDSAAQPEIRVLATMMKEAYDASEPELLVDGEWHLPYVTQVGTDENDYAIYSDSSGERLNLEDAIKVSASCCAQVSYRKLNDTKEKALEIYARLFGTNVPHLSPTEHQARPMSHYVYDENSDYWAPGVTHRTRNGDTYSGNLKGWIQYRQLLEQKASVY